MKTQIYKFKELYEQLKNGEEVIPVSREEALTLALIRKLRGGNSINNIDDEYKKSVTNTLTSIYGYKELYEKIKNGEEVIPVSREEAFSLALLESVSGGSGTGVDVNAILSSAKAYTDITTETALSELNDIVANTYQTKNIEVGVDLTKLSDWAIVHDNFDISLSTIAYGNGIFIAADGSGKGYFSTNGTEWNKCNGIVFSDIVYGNDKFVSVDTHGGVSYSTDGINWTVGSGEAGSYGEHVTYGNGMFVAVETCETSCSTDGVTWNVAFCDDTFDPVDIAHGNGVFVTVGGSYIHYSHDPSKPYGWSIGKDFSDDGVSMRGVTYGNGMFVAISSNRSYYSTDGVNWTAGSGVSGTIDKITYGNGMFVAVGSGVVYYSTDGVNWTAGSGVSVSLGGITYGNNMFVAVKNRTIYSTTFKPKIKSIEEAIAELYAKLS